jgi:LPXTG-motif cell wall-anchored protein
VDQTSQILLLVGAVALFALAAVLILRRQRLERLAATRESPYAVSTEGEKRCPNCGMGNLWTDRNCISCKARLPG